MAKKRRSRGKVYRDPQRNYQYNSKQKRLLRESKRNRIDRPVDFRYDLRRFNPERSLVNRDRYMEKVILERRINDRPARERAKRVGLFSDYVRRKVCKSRKDRREVLFRRNLIGSGKGVRGPKRVTWKSLIDCD